MNTKQSIGQGCALLLLAVGFLFMNSGINRSFPAMFIGCATCGLGILVGSTSMLLEARGTRPHLVFIWISTGVLVLSALVMLADVITSSS